MPLANVDLLRGRSGEEIEAICGCVHEAMVTELDVPERDRFQIVTEHDASSLHFDRSYLDIDRSEMFVLVRVTLAAGRTADAKQAFYATLARLLSERADLRPQDLAVCLTENAREDWSFGCGQASYLALPKSEWR